MTVRQRKQKKKIQVLTSSTKLREYVALLYTTSNCLCHKSDEVITAMYFQWRPVNYSQAERGEDFAVKLQFRGLKS